MSYEKCSICQSQYAFSWTDTHGVAQCFTCGVPYRIYHYEEVDGKSERVDKSPALLIKDEYISVIQQYWRTHHRRVPGGHSIPGGYELATDEEARLFNDWMGTIGKQILGEVQ